ncbi:MAG: hypothetical protein JWO86_310 [Myxococcaceae bacterium]|nr:hypothetical protein [Myxococcaceae bacterium]MEA2749287.1 hypothetical protein [Myxococcales bacterium]
MLIVDSLIVGGVRFVLNKLIEAVDAEMYDESSLREELLAAQMKLELGEIDEAELARIEEVVLAGLREIGERKRAAAASGSTAPAAPNEARAGRRFTVESVEADLRHREEPDE